MCVCRSVANMVFFHFFKMCTDKIGRNLRNEKWSTKKGFKITWKGVATATPTTRVTTVRREGTNS